MRQIRYYFSSCCKMAIIYWGNYGIFMVLEWTSIHSFPYTFWWAYYTPGQEGVDEGRGYAEQGSALQEAADWGNHGEQCGPAQRGRQSLSCTCTTRGWFSTTGSWTCYRASQPMRGVWPWAWPSQDSTTSWGWKGGPPWPPARMWWGSSPWPWISFVPCLS